jgi:membrane protease YdiL (CAAX protease family)
MYPIIFQIGPITIYSFGAFCWFRRLWPVAVAHAVYNLMVILLPQLMGYSGNVSIM